MIKRAKFLLLACIDDVSSNKYASPGSKRQKQQNNSSYVKHGLQEFD
jgi:hypothetical protein